MFLALLNNIASTIVVIFAKRLNPNYAVILGVMSAVGAIPGVILSNKLVEWTGKPSSTVWFLIFLLVFFFITHPTVSAVILSMKTADGYDIMVLSSFC
jgi:uncharacterized membrane protein YfcA